MRSQNIQKDLSLIGDNLINKFIQKDKILDGIIDHFYEEKNILKKTIDKKEVFPDENRKVLVDQLKKQYSEVKLSKETFININSLIDSNTFTITTGHQLNLFTGPIMVIYKIAQVISMARFLNSKIKNFNYVPIFWLASEDHDFDEISYVNISNEQIKWDIDSYNNRVGKIILNDFNRITDDYKSKIIDAEFKIQLEELINQSYINEDSLSFSTLKFINSLFGKHGLIIIDPDKKAFKELFIENFKNEIIDSRCKIDTENQIEKNKKDIESYKPQVNPSEINFFKITSKGRKRIRRKNNAILVDDEKEYSTQEFINQIESNPERFSPNVLMRPLFQEKILPNICYVGGPNELKYWMQLKLFFDNSNLQYPILKLRSSAFIIDQKTSLKIKKTDVELEYFFKSINDLVNYKLKKLSTVNVSFDSIKETLSDQFNKLRDVSNKTNKSFEGALNAQEKKQMKGIDDLEKKLIKAEKKNHQEQISNIKIIFESLHPSNVDQERHLNFANFYSVKGQALIDHLVDKVLIPDDKILVINLED